MSSLTTTTTTTTTTSSSPSPARPLPHITITYCTQCKWLLRAAYFAQELLSTFSAGEIAEVSLRPSTGGIFRVEIEYVAAGGAGAGGDMGEGGKDGEDEVKREVLWDRKERGGFPETKVLKRAVRDCIEPGRDLGHVDRHGKGSKAVGGGGKEEEDKKKEEGGREVCVDCQP